MILLRYTRPPGLVFDSRDPAILELTVCKKLFFNLAQLGLDPSTARLTVHASSNCATLTLTVQKCYSLLKLKLNTMKSLGASSGGGCHPVELAELALSMEGTEP